MEALFEGPPILVLLNENRFVAMASGTSVWGFSQDLGNFWLSLGTWELHRNIDSFGKKLGNYMTEHVEFGLFPLMNIFARFALTAISYIS